jgi:hypothetical protein
MDNPDQQATSYFTQPFRQIILMLVSLGLVGFGGYIAYPRVESVFLANPYLNGFIAFVFVIGVIACFWQVVSLLNSVVWIEGFANDRPGHDLIRAPRLLAPLAALLRSRGARMQINSTSARSILDSVATRIDEARDITRYITNLLIFLGLLGTFYGLATTVPAVVETIRSLAPQDGDTGVEIFSRLMNGLEQQLGGMGVAFASSLLGLAGSLVVGLLELFAGHGQNRFYRELEEWLSTITRIGLSSGDGEGHQGSDVSSALLEHFSEQIDALQILLRQSDLGQSRTDDKITGLTGAVSALVEKLDSSGPAADNLALNRVAEGQAELIEVLKGREESGGGSGHVDAESRMRLRSIDVQLLRILEEMSAGRQESVADLRDDLAALTKAVRSLADAQSRGR